MGSEPISEKGLFAAFVTSAQRLQHGDVVVLDKLNGITIQGLRRVGHLRQLDSNVSSQAKSCQAFCYSNIRCKYWVYNSDGCWVDDPSLPFLLKPPSDSEYVTRQSIVGEHIQHVCPSEPHRAMLLSPSEAAKDNTQTAEWG